MKKITLSLLSLLSLLFITTISVHAQDVTVTEVDVSTIIQDGTFKIYAFGYGADQEQERAEIRARTQAAVQILEVLNGYSFTYREEQNSYMFRTEASGQIEGLVTEATIPVAGDTYAIIQVVSLEMDQSKLNTDNLLAYKLETELQGANRLRTAIGRTRAQGMKEFATLKGTNWAQGTGYLSNIDLDIRDDGSIGLSYVMLIAVE